MIKQSPSNKIVHVADEDDDGGFQQPPQDEEENHHLPTLAQMGILDQANPIYSGIAEPQTQEAKVGLSLKIVPRMRDQLIETYQPFSIGGDGINGKANNSDQTNISQSDLEQKKKAQQLQKQLQNNIMFTSKQSPFSDLYEPEQLVYQKIDNSRFNKFREVLYFTGLFIPRDNLIDSFKEKQSQSNIVEEKGNVNQQNLLQNKKYYGMCEIMSKQLNKISQKIKNKNYKKISKPQPYVVNTSQKDSIIFDSNFQSGNLFAAFRTGKYSYQLLVSNDTNSRGTKQWFYFSMANIISNTNYRITIVNFNKKNSLFNHGLLPVLYSMKENKGVEPTLWSQDSGTMGWIRFGKDVCYYKGEILRENSCNKYYSALTFVINWKQSGDKIYLAHSYPYGYDKLVRLLDGLYLKNYGENISNGKKSKLQIDNQNANNAKNTQNKVKNGNKSQQKVPLFSQQNSLKIKKLGKTIGRNWIYAIQLKNKQKNLVNDKKQAIIIMARQHPGETQGSFVCEGVIKKLIEQHTSKQSTYLLKNYTIYIIPMVNPDGVVHGHYRTNLCGKDLNRKWEDPQTTSSATPEIIIISKFINQLTTKHKFSVRFILDLHGHSKKLNSFFYGNPCPERPEVVKMYPYICSRLNQAVQYMDCTFNTEEYKKKAARIYLSTNLKQINVYTFQSSFYGYTPRQTPNKVKQFTPKVYEQLGKTLIDSLYVFLLNNSENKPETTTNQQTQEQKDSENPQKQSRVQQYTKKLYKEMKKQLIQNQRLIGVGDVDSSGSQSNPQEGQLNIEDIKIDIEDQGKQRTKDGQVTNDERVIGMGIRKAEHKQASSTSTRIKISQHPNRKSAQQIIEYKDFSRPVRNVKYLALSQVNAVLPDKYHISLQPMEAMAYKIGRKIDMETQTQRMQKNLFKIYKAFQIEQKDCLFGIKNIKQKNTKEQEIAEFRDDRYNKKSQQPSKPSQMTVMFQNHPPVVGNNTQKQLNSKKHSEIIANIQKNKMKKQEELNLRFDMIDDDSTIKKRKGNRALKQKFRTVYTQTMVSIKVVQTGRTTQFKIPQKMSNFSNIQSPNNIILQPIPSRWGTLQPLDNSNQSMHHPQSPRTKLMTEEQSRISKMERISKEVLKVYSRKSAMAEISVSTKKSKGSNAQKNIFYRKV